MLSLKKIKKLAVIHFNVIFDLLQLPEYNQCPYYAVYFSNPSDPTAI